MNFDEALDDLINKYLDREYDKVDIADSLAAQVFRLDAEILDEQEG
jgi:hypothetical protein